MNPYLAMYHSLGNPQAFNPLHHRSALCTAWHSGGRRPTQSGGQDVLPLRIAEPYLADVADQLAARKKRGVTDELSVVSVVDKLLICGW